MKLRSIASRLPRLRVAAFAPLTVLFGMPLAYAANLGLSNGTFDAGTNPWIIAGTAELGLEGATACGATKCLQLNINNATVTATSEEKKNVAPGEFVTASAMMKRNSAAGSEDVSLGLVFYGSGNTLIGTTLWSHATGPADTWGSVKVSAIAPPGTVATRVVVRGKSTAKLTAYVDNVVLSKINIEDKGAQVSVPRISAVAIDSKTNAFYVASNGVPAVFSYYRSLEDKEPKKYPLGKDEIWSVVVGADSAAYFGTTSGKFYKYDSTKDAAPELLKTFTRTPSGTRSIWSLKAGPDNCIYGGLEPDGAKSDGFKYCGRTGDPVLLNVATKNGEIPTGYHVRSLAVDSAVSPASGSVYWGMGSHARVYKTGVEGGGVPQLLLQDDTKDYAYFTDFAKDRLFVRVIGTDYNQTMVMYPSREPAGKPVASMNSVGISALSPYPVGSDDPCKNVVFYTKDLGPGIGSHLSSYCIEKGEETTLKAKMSASAAFAYKQSSTTPKLVSVLRDPYEGKGQIVQFNLSDLHRASTLVTPVAEVSNFPAPATATELRTLAVRDGKTYSAGYVNGDIGISDGTTTPPVLVKERLQAEGMVLLGNHLYIGGYPEAEIKSFKLTDAGLVESVAFTNTDLGKLHGQNRPFAMLGLPGKTATDPERLVIGTVPKQGEQGVLALYTVGADLPWTVVKKPFEGQSILALTRIDDIVYGGTSVWRDKYDKPSPGFAKLFTFDPSNNYDVKQVIFEEDNAGTISLDKLAVTALLTVNRQIWALAEDTVLIYDHDTKKIVKKLKIGADFSYKLWTNVWNAGSMVQSNGYVYIAANDTKSVNVYRVNISKPDSVELVRSGESGMMKVDANGDIYFLNETKVMKFNPAL